MILTTMKTNHKNKNSYPANAKKVFTGVFFSIYQWQQRMFDGSFSVFERAERKDVVAVIPFDENELVYIIKEKQPHQEKSNYVLIAGTVEDGESPEDAARRELLEEVGVSCKDFFLVGITSPVPGVEWKIFTFIAKNFTGKGKKNLDRGEKNSVHKISFQKLIEYTRKEKFLYRLFFIERYIIRDEVDKLLKIFIKPEKFKIK